MKIAYLLALICSAGLALNACRSENSRAAAGAAEAVRLKFEAFNRHDAAAIQNLYAPDAVLHSPDYPDLMGNVPIADTYRRLFDAIPDAKDNVQSLGTSGDKVYAEFVLTGHFKGAADKALNVRIMSIYTVKNGEIVLDSTYYDRKSP